LINTATTTPPDQPAAAATPKRRHEWRMLFALSAAVAAAYAAMFVALNWVVKPLLRLLHHVAPCVPIAVLSITGAGLLFLVPIAILIGAPYLVRRRLSTNRSVLGIDRRISWSDLGLGSVVFTAVYFILHGVDYVVTRLIPALGHAQPHLIAHHAAPIYIIMALVPPVVMAPLSEELVFRGWLYGKLLKAVPAVPAAVVTSLLFGLAHWYEYGWGGAIGATVISLFLCGLRSMTGKIWAGVLVHALWNALAFV
jgi:uncharacterized protein